jgi:hypothetical protein
MFQHPFFFIMSYGIMSVCPCVSHCFLLNMFDFYESDTSGIRFESTVQVHVLTIKMAGVRTSEVETT